MHTQHTRVVLLFYLSLAVLLPSYQGFEDGPEFPFFNLFESNAKFDYHSRPEIEAPHDRVRAHAALYFFPSHRLSLDAHKKVADNGFDVIPEDYALTVTEYSGNNTVSSLSRIMYIGGHKSSGLSPPG